jgi:hypothetical protein
MDTKHCINNEIWDKYSKATLRDPEMKRLLTHAASCEICMDIKEGIDLMQKPIELHQRVVSINHRVDEFLNPKPKHNFLFWYSSAAAIFLLAVGLSWLVFNKSNSDTVVKTIDKIEQSEPLNVFKTDSALLPEKIKPNSKKKLAVEETNNKPLTMQVEDLEKYKTDQEILNEKQIESMDDAKFKSKDMVIQEQSSETRFLSVPTDTLASSYQWNFTTSSSVESDVLKKTENVVIGKAQSKPRKALTRAKTSSLPRNYDHAQNKNSSTEDISVNSIGASNILKDSIYYKAAISNYGKSQFGACIQNANILANNPNSSLYEDGLLIKAKALIGLKSVKEAKVILNQIINLNKKHTIEAETLLKTLE